LLDDKARSNFGKLESVAEAAQAAIAKLQSRPARSVPNDTAIDVDRATIAAGTRPFQAIAHPRSVGASREGNPLPSRLIGSATLRSSFLNDEV
jgi:hypothetical protein